MFWAGSGRKDAPKIHSNDIAYIITILINSLKPPSKLAAAMGVQGGIGSGGPSQIGSGPSSGTGKQHLTISEAILQNSSFTHKSMRQLKDLLQTACLLGKLLFSHAYQSLVPAKILYRIECTVHHSCTLFTENTRSCILFLSFISGLKVLIIGFSKQLKREWQRISQAIKLMCNKQSNISPILLSFIDFIISYKTPIFVILRPFLFFHVIIQRFFHENQVIEPNIIHLDAFGHF